MPDTRRPPVVLVVLDGWGISPDREHNAIARSPTPAYTELLERFPHASLVTSGEAVGLPAGQMGNSEVGHMNLGAGRVVYQDLSRIDKSIREGDFFANPALVAAMSRCTSGRHAVHLVGLVSQGGVHSHVRHLAALVELARRQKVERLFLHALTDGRDNRPHGGGRRRGGGGAYAGGRGNGTHRDRHRPLLRDGSRPALGSDTPGVRGADRGRRPHRPGPPPRSSGKPTPRARPTSS